MKSPVKSMLSAYVFKHVVYVKIKNVLSAIIETQSTHNLTFIIMKTIAKFYEKETKDNYCEEKKVIKTVCKETTIEEHYRIEAEMLFTANKSLSFCWWLDNEVADQIASKF